MNSPIINESLVTYVVSHPWLILLLIWTLTWKGMALWKSAKNNHLYIFILFIILNTAGIGEIIYLGYMYFKSKKQISPITPVV